MKVVIISDTHDKLLKTLPEADVLIHCGDYSIFGEYEETKKFFDWFDSQPAKHKIAIPGNHEVGICPFKSRDTRGKIMELIKSYDNITFLIDDHVVIDGVKFYGTPWCGGEHFIMYRWGFYLEGYEQRAQIFNNIPDDTDVLISHSPPFDILDKCDGRTLGCLALLEKIEQVKPLVSCFGHIHSSNGYKERGGTHFFNCSNLGENYKVEYPCRVLEIIDGKLVTNKTVAVYDSGYKKSKETIFDKLEQLLLTSNTDTYMGQEYPPMPDTVVLPPLVDSSDPKDIETEDCIYCNVKLTEKNYAFSTMRGSMCIRCHWEIFD
jgi:Icc-related predicted phosphoesterase